MEFFKTHGIGNDFIIINGFRQVPNDPGALAKRLCPRRFGIGADGLILALPSPVADARMRIINADGGEPEMCGNGIRCLGKYLYDSGFCRENPMQIETLAGELDRTEVARALVARPPVQARTAEGSASFDGEKVRLQWDGWLASTAKEKEKSREYRNRETEKSVL